VFTARYAMSPYINETNFFKSLIINQELYTEKKYFACCVLSFGDSSASEFYVPTFRNTLDTMFRNVGTQSSDPGNHPKERMQHSEQGESLK